MNPVDIIIGLGLGVLITLIIRAVVDSRREKQTKQRKHFHDHTNLNGSIIAINKNIGEIKNRISKLELFKKDSELSLPIIADRLEDLEKRRK